MFSPQDKKNIEYFYQYIEQVAVIYPEMLPEQVVGFYLLSYGDYTIPVKDINETAKWFKNKFMEIYSNNSGESKEEEKNMLVRELLLKAKVKNSTFIKRAYIGFKEGSSTPQKIDPVNILKYNTVFLVEKNEETNDIFFYEIVKSRENHYLFEQVPKIPGVNINKGTTKETTRQETPVEEKTLSTTIPSDTPLNQPKKKTESKIDTTTEVLEEAKEEKRSFSDTFGDTKEVSKEEEKGLLYPHKYFLAIPSFYQAQSNNWMMLDKEGRFLPGTSLADELIRMKNEAKEKGALFDEEKKLWFVPPNQPLSPFKKFTAEGFESSIFGEISATDEQSLKVKIQKDLYASGLDLRGREVAINKGWQNVEIQGNTKSGRPGSYRVSLEGIHAKMECFKHKGDLNRRDIKYEIESRAKSLDPTVTEVRKFFSESISKARAINGNDGAVGIEELEEWEENAKEIESIYNKAIPADPEHPYLVRKGLRGKTYTLRSPKRKNQKDSDLLVPLYDIHGKIWTVEHISALPKRNKWTGLRERLNSAGKKVKRRTRSKACFYIVSQFPVSPSGLPDTVFIAEGFSTAATVEIVTGIPTLAAKSKGNLAPVLQSLFEEFPDKKAIIFADNDVGTDIKHPKINAGLVAAKKAQEKFGKERVGIVECILTPAELQRGWKDFNDIFVELGKNAAAGRIISEVEKQIAMFPVKKSITPAEDNSKEELIPAGKTPP